jgi:hypothetical protein
MTRPRSTVRRLEAAAAALASAAVARMADSLPWFAALSAQERSWIGVVARAGIDAFVEWYRQPDAGRRVDADVFGTAPRALTRAVSLQQTVEMVRVTIEVVEEYADQLAAPGHIEELREAVLRYAREVAFATAQVYAEAAETRGAWDARLEALIVESLLRGAVDEAALARAAALGWPTTGTVWAVAATAPPADPRDRLVALRRSAEHQGLAVLTGTQGDELVAVLGSGASDLDPLTATARLGAALPEGPVVVGPAVADLRAAVASLLPALAGHRVAAAWPAAPRPVAAADLVAERALAGDLAAREQLVATVYAPLATGGTGLLETAETMLEQVTSLEAAARALYVHPNTVRYRLRRIGEVTGHALTNPRGAQAVRLALVYGRLAGAGSSGPGPVAEPSGTPASSVALSL